MKWLAWLMVFMLGVTTVTAEQAWRARSGFEEFKVRLETTSGVSAAERQSIQRSLDRIDRKLEQQELLMLEMHKSWSKRNGQ